MKKLQTISLVFGAVILLALSSLGYLVQSSYDQRSSVFSQQSIETCSLCDS